MVVDLFNNIILFDNQLQRHNVACSMYTLIGTRTTNERRFLGVGCVRLRYGAGRDKSVEQVSLDGLLLVVDLHALVASTRVADHDCDFALRSALFCLDFLCRECCRQSWPVLALLLLLLIFGLLFGIAV